ncbi:long-chain fatty acid transport protein 4 [Tribolium castaneum]|uniref:Very long-chain fatty acid transport protein n=1 Tax=Tribolium castaneum TaxID=7070 RepID=D6WSV8_TRICA|nr:PREDICTED: long-chain fatty acid transport protein 4 [Tribolium castaneum]EFA06666.2 Long-chain fatty acid transport protein 4-like Protein [Tribolium castaneum]|eukprot:XP_967675.1 PREDICTED: long-chain fatty acid transport protein 4 [Tribolium castaneum]
MIFTAVFVILLSIFLLTNRRYRWFYIIYKTLGRDVRAGIRFTILNFQLWRYEKTNQTVAKIFTKLVAKHPQKVAFYFESEIWTFEDVDKYSNKIAHYFKNEGFKRGDAVALVLESRPEYVTLWLGLAKIGVVTALINSNLVADPLAHSIQVADAKAVVYGSDFAKGINDISGKIPKVKLYQFGKSDQLLPNSVDLIKELEKEQDGPLTSDIKSGKPRDKLLFIFTSGTTGLPKAAVITNLRFFFMALGIRYMAVITEDDIIYDPLPLYHSAGAIVGVGQCILKGTTVVIRKKFSASYFWVDCIKYRCTVAQYIGEICRYLLAAHASDDRSIPHQVTKMLGNGLRPQIWNKFVTRFGVKEVYEFYGATEGNSNLINIDSKVGAVGFVPRYASIFYPVTLIKCDEETGAPIRNSDGFCQRCDPGEPGVCIGIVNPKKTVNDFAGYADKKATEKKLIENVFKKGDRYFNSGDILIQDEFGYYFFKDRTGDTFRWKGENVATSEIEAVISNIVDLSDAIVYGVEIPGTEGRAGMVAIVDRNNTLNMKQFCLGLKNNLPSYAVPIFVRVMTTVPMTGTYKLKKTELQKEGFNLEKIQDKLFLYDAKNVDYIELTKEKYHDIMTGKVRL